MIVCVLVRVYVTLSRFTCVCHKWWRSQAWRLRKLRQDCCTSKTLNYTVSPSPAQAISVNFCLKKCKETPQISHNRRSKGKVREGKGKSLSQLYFMEQSLLKSDSKTFQPVFPVSYIFRVSCCIMVDHVDVIVLYFLSQFCYNTWRIKDSPVSWGNAFFLASAECRFKPCLAQFLLICPGVVGVDRSAPENSAAVWEVGIIVFTSRGNCEGGWCLLGAQRSG